jgi:hemerythrin-like domain-containing protein
VKLIDELRAEHELIERVLGSLRTWVKERVSGEPDPRDGEAFVRFFREFSGSFHHGREENVLLPALVAHAELRAKSGPVVALIDQHRSMEATFEEMAPLLLAEPLAPSQKEALGDLATRYSRALWQHIDAENSVLLPESENRLARAMVRELPAREMTPGEAEAKAEGERLVRTYPQAYDPGAIRGEGCVICPSHGVTCEGVEREWWNDWEWESFGRGQE